MELSPEDIFSYGTLESSYIIRHWRLVEMEGEIAKQTPQLNSMFSNPSPPRIRVRAGTELHGDFELPGNCRCVFFTVIAI